MKLSMWDWDFEEYGEYTVSWGSREFKVNNLDYIVIARKESNVDGWATWCEVFLKDKGVIVGNTFGLYKRIDVPEKNNLSIEDLDEYFDLAIKHILDNKGEVEQ